MGCTRHFLNFEWEHHTWRPQVVSEKHLHSRETTMWGGSVNQPYTVCQKHYVCERCGKTTDTRSCVCDPEVGDRCEVRLAWVNEAKAAA